MPEISVDPQSLKEIQAYCEAQRDAMEKTRAYLKQHTDLPLSSYGLLLMLAKPMSEVVAQFAMMGFDFGAKLVNTRATAIATYVEEQGRLEQAQTDLLGRLQGLLDGMKDGAGRGGLKAPDAPVKQLSDAATSILGTLR